MICCLNPSCENPPCASDARFCNECGIDLIILENRYRPLQSIGRGGFGKTYLAEDIKKFGERCVIKQFAPYSGNNSNTEKLRFRDEAKQLQRLGEHPQIPALLAFFDEGNYLYFVQQYVDGENLAQELEREGLFNEGRVRKFLTDLLEILVVVHDRGIIHRDIKPYNIMRRRVDRQLVLIDFGISKQAEANSATGTSIGSLGYSPLEQFWGGKAYPASDLYSLGATAFYLMSGISPHQIVLQLLEEASPAQAHNWVENWRSYVKQPMSDNLGAIMDKLLDSDYKQRYQSATVALTDLRAAAPLKSKSNHDRNALTVVQGQPSHWRNLKFYLGGAGVIIAGGLLIYTFQPSPTTVPAGNSTAASEARTYLELGKSQSSANKDREALTNLTKSIELQPTAVAYLERGRVRDNLNDKQGAIDDFNEAIKLSPNSAEAYYLRGSRYRDTGNNNQALEDLNRAINLQANHLLARIERGNLYADLGDRDRALADLTTAIKIDARSSYAYMSRAGIYASTNEKEKAIADYDRSIVLDPTSYYDVYQRGILHQELNQITKAKADFVRAMKLAKQAGKDKEYADIAARLKQLK